MINCYVLNPPTTPRLRCLCICILHVSQSKEKGNVDKMLIFSEDILAI